MEKKSSLSEIVKFILIAVVIVVPIRMYIAQPFVVSGVSMDPTFKTDDYLVIDEFTYHFNDPKREDVIVMKYPRDTHTYFIKRIIGLPGETVTAKNGEITIFNKENPNGLVLEGKYVAQAHKSSESFSVTLSDSEYFVMGDNRKESSDSRFWGPLPKKDIVGRPLVRLFPFNKIEGFPGSKKVQTVVTQGTSDKK